MKITKILSKNFSHNSFFRISGTDYTICEEFTKQLIGEPLNKILSVKFTLATKNPKTKGFKKILYKYTTTSIMGGIEYDTISSQQRILKQLGIEVGDYYWMKAETVN
jgi:hypothetical protein